MNPYFISWSGGKDSCLALQKAMAQFGRPNALLTMFVENGQRSRSHGLRKAVIEAQASALGVRPFFYSTSWSDYERTFQDALRELKQLQIGAGVFGDIKIDGDLDWCGHRKWADDMCEKAGMTAVEPLWQCQSDELLKDFLHSGIKAVIVAAKDGVVDKKYLGAKLDRNLIEEFKKAGIHPFGERGEYHTLVLESPLFKSPLPCVAGHSVYRDGYWFLDFTIR